MGAGGLGEGDGYGGYRERLVETLRDKGIRDLAVLRAVRMVPRHLFVPASVRHRAYDDAALPIGGGQTISQPWVQARYLELLALDRTGARARDRRRLRLPDRAARRCSATGCSGSSGSLPLAQGAREALERAGVRNVTVLVGDGTLGWRPFAPYDAILVAAASPEIPAPLVEQLAPGGRMVIPLGDRASQTLTLVRREGDQLQHQHRRRRALRAPAGRVRLPLVDQEIRWTCCAASSTSSFTWTRT